ncbi:MAG: 4Fe-4S dicluster domain-containing protein [Desulfobacteraceae bacterium]|nr:4Fe-4S dicluster domain-containing protein [Desulfobacteraceae bacterium]
MKAPEDRVTGTVSWYASTCRECPAGCGVLAANREGRVIKLEGNPLHPVNKGKLCARGQAALQGLYNPDRLVRPLLKTDDRWEEISYPKAFDLLEKNIEKTAQKGPDRIGMLTETVGDVLLALFKAFFSHYRSTNLYVFEPFVFESLKYVHARVLANPMLPGYRLDRADLIVGFGADFLETWLSPVEYARKFKNMHSFDSGQNGTFVHVAPFRSLTGANADQWIACRPHTEGYFALALINEVFKRGRGRKLTTPFRASLNRMLRNYNTEMAANICGVSQWQINNLVFSLMEAKRPLVLSSPTASAGTSSIGTDLAAVLLNILLDPKLPLYDFDQRHRVEIADSRSGIQKFWEKAGKGQMDTILLHQVNPAYSMPSGDEIVEILGRQELFSVAFTHFMDQTAAACDLVFPIKHFLESWDSYESKQGITTTLQPVAGKFNDAPQVGDVFLELFPRDKKPGADYKAYLVDTLTERHAIDTSIGWVKLIQSGGWFAPDKPAATPELTLGRQTTLLLRKLIPKKPSAAIESDKPVLYTTSSLRFYDGRGANRPWLCEIPETLTQIAWQSVALVSESLMSANHCKDGDSVQLRTGRGQIELPAYTYPGLYGNAVVTSLGLGHEHYGRYARKQGVNPVAVLDTGVDSDSGAPFYAAGLISLKYSGKNVPLALTSGSRSQLNRKIALNIPIKHLGKVMPTGIGLTMDTFPMTLPLPEGYNPQRDIYPAHDHDTCRWSMVVDLDRCTGCSACVAACYAENNIGVVGQQRIIEGREMAWIRIERYEDPEDPASLIFLPMMCQHCDNAPCKAVCPVYAPHHSKQGLNNQIYNRCIGTRFCAQNCPYKVRRFNWFDWQWPEPLNQQLNPNVTVRSKGVMEKCSFCIQRIKQAHDTAKNENRAILDGEVIPACVQTCPADALYFGNLMDKASTVRKMIRTARAYQVMGYLNTKPAVIYLKKVVRTI